MVAHAAQPLHPGHVVENLDASLVGEEENGAIQILCGNFEGDAAFGRCRDCPDSCAVAGCISIMTAKSASAGTVAAWRGGVVPTCAFPPVAAAAILADQAVMTVLDYP